MSLRDMLRMADEFELRALREEIKVFVAFATMVSQVPKGTVPLNGEEPLAYLGRQADQLLKNYQEHMSNAQQGRKTTDG
jgi:hypothetical protein